MYIKNEGIFDKTLNIIYCIVLFIYM